MTRTGVHFAVAALIATGLSGCATSFAIAPVAAPVTKERVAASEPVGRSAAGNYLAAEHAGMERDTAGSSRYFARAIDADPDNVAILEHAFLLDIAQGNIEHAAKLAQRIVILDPSSRMARLILSLADLKAGRFSEAGKEIDAASNHDAADAVWATIRAWAYAGSGEAVKAVPILASDEARKNLGAFARYHEALILDFAGRTQDAERAYAAAIVAADAGSVRLLEAYGRFLTRTGRVADAVRLYSAYNAKAPGNPVIEALLADAKSAKPDTHPMIASPAQGGAEALYGIAIVLSGEHSPELPLVYVQLALYLEPQLDIALALRGELLEAEEDWSSAAKSFAAIPSNSPLAAFASIAVAHDFARLERLDDATALMRARVKKEPRDLEALVALGDLYRAQEKWTDAAAVYGQALSVAKPDQQWQILYARGVSLERAGDWPQAEKLLQQALTQQPDQPQILNYLGYSWIDRGEHLKEALKLIGKAVAAKPDDGYIVDSLGWAYYRLGDYANATRYLEHAVELKPDDPTINDHLGDAYWRVGRRLEAHFQWNHALTFKPEPDDAKKIAKKLEGGLQDQDGTAVPGSHS